MLDLNTYPNMHPAAALSLGAVEFGRGRLWGVVKDLTPDQLATKPAQFANDIATIILHIGATEVAFSHLVQGKDVPADLRERFLLDQRTHVLPRPAGETVSSLQEKLATSLDVVRATLSGLTEADFSRQITLSGNRPATVRWAVGMLAVHQSQHLGQIQTLVKHL